MKVLAIKPMRMSTARQPGLPPDTATRAVGLLPKPTRSRSTPRVVLLEAVTLGGGSFIRGTGRCFSVGLAKIGYFVARLGWAARTAILVTRPSGVLGRFNRVALLEWPCMRPL